METSEIASRIKSFLENKFPYQDVTLTDTTNLLEEWFVDSLGIVETVHFIETSFDIDLTRADINGVNFRDISTLSSLVAGRITK